MEGATAVGEGYRQSSSEARPLFVRVLLVLFAIGWAANHFTGLMPAVSDSGGIAHSTRDAIFGIYALGLLPGLLGGGRLSDAFGRFPMACAGALSALAGTLLMLVSVHPDALLLGRLIVGIGVGLTVSSCTAWASDLQGPVGAATAGTVLSVGFAVGPLVSGVIASLGQPGIRVCFATAATLVVLSLIAVVSAYRANIPSPRPSTDSSTSAPQRRGAARAVSWAMPLAPWIFASVCLAGVSIPSRVHTTLTASLATGTATMLAIASGVVVQLVARSRGWGPQSGTVGALLAAAGYAATAAAPPVVSLWLALPLLVVLGCAYGLCLREGLVDLEAAAPQAIRGALTGAFYAFAYLGFGLPLLLTIAGPARGSALTLAGMSILATLVAVNRAIRLRQDQHRRPRAPIIR